MDSAKARNAEPFQFSLRSLLVCTLLVGVALGLGIPFVAAQREAS